METPAPTAMENNNNLKLNIDSDEYQLMFYIERSKLVFKLQNGDNNPDKIFQKDFLLNELKQLNPAFRGFDNLEDVRLQFSLILNNEVPKAEKKENSIDLIINIYGKKTIIPLKKFEMDLNYDNLSEEMKKIIDENKIILGIDLGTTYSCASVMLDDHVVIMENSLGLRTTPSYVCFFEHDKICVGELAKLQPSYEYKNIIYNVKRLFGRNINDKEIKEIIHDLPFDLEEDKDLNQLKININFKTSGKNLNVKEYYPEQVAALILKKLIKDSEYYLAKKLNKEIKIKDVVITVPAYFNQKQREATYQAAKIINLDVKRMINEPTAASLAYGYKEIENNEKLITVLDFGGGTLDLTLLKFMKCGNNIYYDVKFSFGDTHFGGEDFDYILMKKCLKEIGKNDMNKKLQCNIRLKRACEIAKIKLSTCDYTNIILEEYSKDSNINFILTKKEFENLCHPIFTKFEGLLNKFLKSCGYENRKISEVILIGGTTLIPKVEEIIKKVFKYSEIKKNLNPKEAVARGAAIQGAMLSNLSSVRNLNLLDVTNLSLGIKMLGNKMSKIIKRSTPIPEERSETYKTTKDNQTEALIEIFEGEDESTQNNLFLGNFTICNLPKMKEGEAKILVKISIDINSILNVTAYDQQNNDNYKQLKIKRPKGLGDKLDKLKESTEKIEENELDEYNEIKDSIIDSEEEITKTNDKKQIKEINFKIINTLENFVINIFKKISKEKVVISYIKYYFLKIMKYLENNYEEKIIKNFSKNLNSILEEIQFNSIDLIFEIIELFVDNKKLYSQCLVQMRDYYYEKIAKKFFEVNVLLHEKPNNYKEALLELQELKGRIKYVIKFCDNQNEEDIKSSVILVQTSVKELALKISVKEIIIRNKQKPIDFSIKGEKENLEKLLIEYQQCKSNDIKDLIDLESIIKNNNVNISQEEKKASNFITNFEKMKDDNLNKFLYIFDKYNLTEYYTDTDIINKITISKERDKFILELCSKYQKYNQSLTDCPKKEAINKINIYLNHLKAKCSNKEEKLFEDL